MNPPHQATCGRISLPRNKANSRIRQIGLAWVLGIALLTTGCGGGGSSSAGGEGFVVAGSIEVQALHHVDSDTNDPESPSSGNDRLTTAQPVRMPAIIGGFVDEQDDPTDVFVAEFEAGDQALLEFPDPARADLDLYLINEDGRLVDASIGLDGFERVVVPEPGEYFVEVKAFSGQSAYRLRLDTSSMLDPLHAASLRVADDFVPGEVLVRRTREIRPSALVKTPADMGLQQVSGAPGREQLWRIPEGHAEAVISTLGLSAPSISPALGWKTPDHAARHDTLRVIKALRAQPDIASASPNYRLKPLLTPNDPRWHQQWFHEAINLPQAWDITTGQAPDAEVVVAVIDTGVYREHEDLDADRLFPTQRFACDPADSTCDEERSWHGTHVTGIIGATSHNSLGVAGISWGVDLLPVWTLNNTGTLNDTLQGIRYAAGLENDSGTVPEQTADIINLSLGGGGYSEVADELFQEVRELGILVIAASGNDGRAEVGYPAAYESVVAVGATNRNSERAWYSNYGPRLDLVAPGGGSCPREDGILSTWVQESPSGTLESDYEFLLGTSMSTAVVSGVLALGRGINPELSPGLLLELLEAGELTRDLRPEGWDPETGWGEIDAYRAVQAIAARAGAGELAPRISATPNVLDFGFTGTRLDLRLRNGGDGALRIEDISPQAPWATLQPHDVTEDGLGLYRAQGQRDTLPPGNYESRVRVTAEGGDQRDIPIGIQVAERAPERDTVGQVYVLLLDRDDRVVAQTTLEPAHGAYHYRFEGVPAGDYRVVAGTNIAGEGQICSGADACGEWPRHGAGETFLLDSDRTGLDFEIAWRPFTDGGFSL